ncbi:cell-cycle control medial ring component-domain-containing protein [Xylariaceae sp. FL1272]|nr:cell-cycle control medial ring component-domain-containing protein [Xylariaceae sp. FL1272]
MTEVSFAKSFLAALDGRPIKLSPDHVEDPKTYQARNAYTLSKMPKAMSKRKPSTTAPGQERSLTVTVKSLRNPPLDLRFSSQPLNTSILDIKASISKETGIAEDKIKVLHKKKPVADSKVLKDLAAGDETVVEFSVMVMGGAAALPKTEAQKDVAQGSSGTEVLESQEFWDDLKGFLMQRIRDEQVAADLTSTFHGAWKAKG